MALRLTSDHFPQLVTFLAEHLPSALKVHGAVLGAIDNPTNTSVWVDEWPSPKALVTKPEGQGEFISNVYNVFALDKSALGTVLPEVVEQRHWKDHVVFAAISEDYFPVLGAVASKYDCRLETQDVEWAHLYYLGKGDLHPVSPPEGMTFGDLTPAHAQLLNDSWTHTSGEESLEFFQTTVKTCPTVGLFDKNEELAAFELMYYYGAMGCLYVIPGHRRKGYACSVVAALTQKLLASGRTPFVYLVSDNEASIKLHQKLGFIKSDGGPVAWPRAVRKNTCSKSCGKSKCCV